jgi:hypothetical protein
MAKPKMQHTVKNVIVSSINSKQTNRPEERGKISDVEHINGWETINSHNNSMNIKNYNFDKDNHS